MPKKNNILLISIIILLILLVATIFFLFIGVTINKQTQDVLNNLTEMPKIDCGLFVDKTTTVLNNDITLSIDDGKDSKCTIYEKKDRWVVLDNVRTDNQGQFSKNYQTKRSGIINYGAICENNCTTNKVSVEVTCLDSDNGQHIFDLGVCNDGTKKTDYCKNGDFTPLLIEYFCNGTGCEPLEVNCETDHEALCYKGICIRKDLDTDDDGISDLDELQGGSDLEDPNDPIAPVLSCNEECELVGWTYGGYYTGGVTCDDFDKYLSASQCCCRSEINHCQAICGDNKYSRPLSMLEGFDCETWAGNDCIFRFNVTSSPQTSNVCCCWSCNN